MGDTVKNSNYVYLGSNKKTKTVEHLQSTEPKADYKASHYADAFCSLC